MSSVAAGVELVPPPPSGRVFHTTRRVRLGDVTPADRVRVDALARYLQDLARDDSADSALENPMGWVVRRTALRVEQWPVFQEGLRLATWCSGIGPRWAERRSSIVGELGGAVEAATLWVHVDATTGRPARLVPGFAERYAEAAAGRGADAKLLVPAEAPPGARERPWPLRHTDFDLLGHVNNAAYWEGLEELLDFAGPPLPVAGVVEHRLPVEPGVAVRLVDAPAPDGGLGWWIVGPDGAAAAGRWGPAEG